MGRLRTIIQTSSDVITGKTTLIAKTLLASAALTLGFWNPVPTPETVEAPEIQPLPVVPYEATWKCEDCSPEEQYVLEQLQEHTKITDPNVANIAIIKLFLAASPHGFFVP